VPFQYQPFDGSRYAASIADALAQMAAPDARAADMRGQVAGQTARQIAQTIGAIPQQIQAGKDAAQERELRQQQLTAGAGELKDKEAARATATQRRVATSVGWAASKATSPEDFAARVDGLAAGGAIPMDTAAHIKQTVGSDAWDAVKQRYVDFASQFMEPVKLGEGDQLIDPMTHQPVVTNPKPTPQPTEAGLAAAANDPTKTPAERAAAQAALDTLRPQSGPKSEWEAFMNTAAQKVGRKTWAEMTPQQQEQAFTDFGQRASSGELKPVMFGGRQVFASWDPKAKTLTYNGQDITTDAKPVPPASVQVLNQQQSSTPGDWNKSGEDFLATIPVRWRNTVKKIAQYDEDITKITSQRGGERSMVQQWVNQVNPAYDQSIFANRNPTRKAFTTGTQGQQINAMNTAVGHIDQLTDQMAALGNGTFTPGESRR
jgi:hypothetical protein